MSVVTHSGETEDSKTAEVTADALDPLVGQTLDGRFRIVDVIGKGAMGKVYRAVQVPLNRAVAIKVLDSRYGAGREESFKQRFLVEAALTAKLNHPNTVRVVDYGSTKDGLFFIAMEYLDGETLEKVLSRGPLPWHRVLLIGQQIARGLREAHELGVVHRDLKPANVILLAADDDIDFAKVLDFGLVKSFIDGYELEGRAITQQGMLMGSPPYMAPEQGEQNRADPRSDIYSLGTMLYEMLSGKPPFTGQGALDVILKHVHEPVPPLVTPQKFEPPPEAFTALVLKCLAKSPMDRFQSMEELLLAFQDVAPTVNASLERRPTQELPATEAVVPVVEAPPAAPAPVVLAPPPSSNTPLFVVGFLVAAAVGVFSTWLLSSTGGPPQKLLVRLESTPPGASVVVDDKVLGVTPLELEQGASNGKGTLHVVLEKDGFARADVTVEAAGGRMQLSQTLTALPPQEAPRAPEEAPEAQPQQLEPTPPAPPPPAPMQEEKPARPDRKRAAKHHPRETTTAPAAAPATEPAAPPAPPPSKDELKRPSL